MDVLIIIGFVALVVLLGVRFRGASAPRTCCSAKAWPPDDLSAKRSD